MFLQYCCMYIAVCMANSIDPDQLLHFASDLGLHCLQRPICLNTKGYYGILIHLIFYLYIYIYFFLCVCLFFFCFL